MYLYVALSNKFIFVLKRGYWRSLLFDPTSQNRVAPISKSVCAVSCCWEHHWSNSEEFIEAYPSNV
ncbi:hypothetical protein NIES3585_32880 [Nodularia sp. NIES-3585]|nr:hypothetical protein NIES3585_32880 [Nodularia sp. NIES-3585]